VHGIACSHGMHDLVVQHRDGGITYTDLVLERQS
jgi:hypothetical protein